MPTEINSLGIAKVQEYGLVEFLTEVQRLVKEGYEMDTKTNENFPMQVGAAYFSVGMKKVETAHEVQKDVVAVVNDSVEEVAAPVVPEPQVIERPTRQSRKIGK